MCLRLYPECPKTTCIRINKLKCLHATVYTPPNAAKEGFCLFDEKTGKAKHIKQTHYYSVRGKRFAYSQV